MKIYQIRLTMGVEIMNNNNMNKFNRYIRSDIYSKWKDFKPEIANQSNQDVLDIFSIIDGEVVSSVKAIADKKPKDLHIRIHSPGGMISSCTAIINLLKGINLTTEIVGIAASCAGILFLLGEKRLIYPTSSLLLHNVWVVTVGDVREHESAITDLKTYGDMIENEVYSKKLSNLDKSFRDYIEADRFMTKDEMEKYGAFTELLDGVEDKEKEQSKSESKVAYNSLTDYQMKIIYGGMK